MKRVIYLILLTFLLFFSMIISQDYFPLEVGNRWDYIRSTGYPFYSTWRESVIVLDTIVKENGMQYFVLSNDFVFDYEFVRVRNDSIFGFISSDSSDCFIFTFSNDSTYYDCQNNKIEYI